MAEAWKISVYANTRSMVQLGRVGLAAVLTALIFVFDLAMPSGVGIGVTYMGLVVLGVWSDDRRFVFALSATATALIVLGYFFSHGSGPPLVAAADRALALVAVWVTALVIFERLSVQHSLAESESRTRSIMDHTADGIVTIGETGLIESFSKSAEKIFGYEAEEAIGKNVSILMTGSDAMAHDGHLRRYRETGHSGIIGVGPREVTGKRKDGSTFPLELAVGEMTHGDERLFIGVLRDISERGKIEGEAAAKSTLLETTIDAMAQGVVVYDADERLLAFNAQYESLIGFPPGFLQIGMHIEETLRYLAESGQLGPGDPEDLCRERLKRFRTGSEKVGERTLAHGTAYMYHRKKLPGGGFVTTFTDLTKQKSAEQKISAQAALLEATFQNMSQGIAVFDGDLNLAAFNPQFPEIIGYPPGFLKLGMSREEIHRYRALRGDIDSLLSPGKPEDTAPKTAERTLANGRTYLYVRTPMPSGGFISTATDITDRKRAEQELAAQSRLLEATFENMTQGIAVFDHKHTLVAFNSPYAEILGLPSDYLHTGMDRRDIIRYRAEQGHYGECDIEALVVEMLSKASQAESIKRTLPNGTTYFYERTPMPDGGYISTAMDITERHEAERQLQQAQKMEAVGQLTGGIAHDFNNLLAVTLGNLELAKETLEQGGDVRQFVETAIRATERGASLTSQLMAFSRRQALNPEVTDVGTITAELADFTRRILSAAIDLHVESQDGLWPVFADRSQLSSAVLNLIVNARDAMPDGGRITVAAFNVTLFPRDTADKEGIAPGPYVEILVTDTGCGMTPEVLEHVFEPFFTTKKVGEGSGLGLSMVYGFAKQSGGYVVIESEPGRGTKVRVWLPQGKDEPHVAAPGVDATDHGHGETQGIRGKILLVEDDGDVRATTAAMLTSAGYDVIAVEDGPKALAVMAGDQPPDIELVLSDIVLTGPMNGIEVAETLKARHPDLKIVFMTGYADLDSVTNSDFIEGWGLIRKPFTKANLIRLMEDARASKAA